MKKKLWAPWRMEYVSNPSKKGNIFLEKAQQNNDRENLVLYRGKYSFVLMNLYPYNNGHLMVAPYEQYDDMTLLNSKTMLEIMEITKKSISILKNKLNSEGINFGLNMGKAAGAGIDEHLHFHIVPRWGGDANFMPILGHTEVIMQSLFDTYDLLKTEFDLIDF
ncbi:HIT domain-containing protein [Candidatus Marinimicrobia bacterium]|nr:HIT domain-containing protein [Candidatus Neomarinimicrobiota bacterium]|tara:strand:- start:1662 stop:2153 length:492 start_codon:yes stop_codon:yes gene_type:complete